MTQANLYKQVDVLPMFRKPDFVDPMQAEVDRLKKEVDQWKFVARHQLGAFISLEGENAVLRSEIAWAKEELLRPPPIPFYNESGRLSYAVAIVKKTCEPE